MARPRKATEDLFSETVSFTLRPAQLLTLRQRAAAAGLSLSAFIRTMLLTGKVVMRESRMDHATYDQLRRIGVNLNQAVHRLHKRGTTPPELVAAAAAVERFITENLDDGPQGGEKGPQL